MIKNKILFYLLSIVWGLPMTLIGGIATIILLIMGKRPKKYGYCYHFTIGKNWGGVNLGIIFITSEDASDHTCKHELGHGVQNCRYGILMPFIVCIPSVVRYWYRELCYNRKGVIPPTKYDDAWYEGEASRLGAEFMNWYNTK